ncbi:MAG: hypothetical protein K0Q46_1001 [Rhodococcus erythropolis]|nr:hypothetical protein [Rhodococcus erythropolis]
MVDARVHASQNDFRTQRVIRRFTERFVRSRSRVPLGTERCLPFRAVCDLLG